MNPEIHCMAGIENPYFCLLSGRLAFVGFSLPKLGNGFSGLPERIVQRSVKRWGVFDTDRFRTNPNRLALRGLPFG
jgi:hypothetical protein